MDVELKSIGEEAVPRLADIFYGCLQRDYIDVLPQEVLSSFTLQESLSLWSKSFAGQESSKFIGAWSGDQLFGFAKFGQDPENARNGYLASLYVDPSQSGKGVGRVLLAHVLQALSVYSQTRLWVFSNNSRAIKLYESLGFSLSGRTRVEVEWKVLQSEMVLNNAKPD
jgi:ribosomal protein S18 acetylase RimI-like enzyme